MAEKEHKLPYTAEDIENKLKQIDDNKEDIRKLSATIDDMKQNGTGTGSSLTQAQITALDGMFKKCAYTGDVTAEYEAFKTAFCIESGGEEEPDTPDEPDVPEVTLSSISATYTGGEVAVGTALTDLTGITVKATYSDGSTSNVTGYTLSGTIAEGSNTITVSYGGKTTTFTVVGYVEEVDTTEPVYQLAQATTFDGTNAIETEYDLFDVDKNWSMVIDFNPTSKSSNMCLFSVGDFYHNGISIVCRGSYFWDLYCGGNYIDVSTKLNESIKTVITHEEGSNEITAYYIDETSNELTSKTLGYGEKTAALIGKAERENLKIGDDNNNTSPAFIGTISAFEVYERMLDTTEINTFMGV